jgi:hypothetical protein
MHMQHPFRNTCGIAISLAMFTPFALSAAAQQASVQGMVIGRDASSMSVKTPTTPRLTVLLSDHTEATAKGGFLGMGRDHLGITALVPGLYVKVDGTYNGDHQLIANKVVFSKSSLNTARQIDAGLNPVNEQLGQQQDQLASNKRDITQSQQDINKAARPGHHHRSHRHQHARRSARQHPHRLPRSVRHQGQPHRQLRQRPLQRHAKGSSRS